MSEHVYHVVTPWAQWVYWESKNVQGYPATHLVCDGAEKTLCGKSADGWMTQTKGDVSPGYVRKHYNPETDALCKVCARIFKRLEAPQEVKA